MGVQQQFQFADRDNNGYIDEKEAMRIGLGQTFKMIDRDGDGKVYEKELLAFKRAETKSFMPDAAVVGGPDRVERRLVQRPADGVGGAQAVVEVEDDGLHGGCGEEGPQYRAATRASRAR